MSKLALSLSAAAATLAIPGSAMAQYVAPEYGQSVYTGYDYGTPGYQGGVVQQGVYDGTWRGAYEDGGRVYNGQWNGVYTDASGQSYEGSWTGSAVGGPVYNNHPGYQVQGPGYQAQGQSQGYQSQSQSQSRQRVT